ncbi:DUF3658 domain-containing protein [Gehongia tenuis]|uniref:DUF1835 domain-containing protein n=1 Tax=Gehongia tenuis TaxID=2763655 RepID=A0A926D132_9FIRM|nr:DUF3658 domain-containing protein [Gehongia tenuis]MBC8530425.1 DUF1835 domain-containing protein [Gehongia tenuis]
MIEIVFSESAGGSLKIAQHNGEGTYPGGCVGVILSHADGSAPTRAELKAAQREAEASARAAWEKAVPLGGNAADVFAFHLALSVGDIGDGGMGAGREAALGALFACYPAEGEAAARELLERSRRDWSTVRARMARGEQARVWYSQQPDEMCGLCWFMAQLRDCPGAPEPALMELPRWESDGETLVQKNGWADVAPEEWHRYLTLQRETPPPFVRACANRWRELTQENAPLRAVVNGRLIGVPENFYDPLILREIAAEEEVFQEARLIGRILGKHPLGIGDGWIALRLEALIESGALEAVSPAPKKGPRYRRTLKKA